MSPSPMYKIKLYIFMLDNVSYILYDVNMKELYEHGAKIQEQTDFVVSWHAKKYNKVIFRVGNLNKIGCRTWESDGKKYMCFWDTVLERYTTCIDPIITYKRKVS